MFSNFYTCVKPVYNFKEALYKKPFLNLNEIMTETPKIETRKVHPVGDGGLYVVIPIEWARKKEIEKGSEVLVLADNQLVIEPNNQERIEEAHELFEDFIGGGDGGG